MEQTGTVESDRVDRGFLSHHLPQPVARQDAPHGQPDTILRQLRDMEGKSYKDIATILNMTEEQVKINIFRARQTIKERFQKIEKMRK